MKRQKSTLDKQTVMAFLASADAQNDLIAAGWRPNYPIAAGWTPSDLREIDEEWESIPHEAMPYTRMLQDIESKARIHDQSTFGPECDPGTNLCQTPMCTAGHLVNMAGEAGCRLRQKYGWGIAAEIIHSKWRPDVPPQNFGSIPQKFAMAYIRERAKEEQERLGNIEK